MDTIETKKFVVKYKGTSSKRKNFREVVDTASEREAVETAYKMYHDDNYFPQHDGSIKDQQGHVIAHATDTTIEYDGGYFYADEMTLEDAIEFGLKIKVTYAPNGECGIWLNADEFGAKPCVQFQNGSEDIVDKNDLIDFSWI